MTLDDIHAALERLERNVEQITKDVARLHSSSKPTKTAKRKRPGVNSYMYWCNNMNMRDVVHRELKQEGENGMTAVAAELVGAGKHYQRMHARKSTHFVASTTRRLQPKHLPLKRLNPKTRFKNGLFIIFGHACPVVSEPIR